MNEMAGNRETNPVEMVKGPGERGEGRVRRKRSKMIRMQFINVPISQHEPNNTFLINRGT